MNGRCRPNPFHCYFAIATFMFNLSIINFAIYWHHHFAFRAFVINYWQGIPLFLIPQRSPSPFAKAYQAKIPRKISKAHRQWHPRRYCESKFSSPSLSFSAKSILAFAISIYSGFISIPIKLKFS